MNPIQISTTLPAWWSDLLRWDQPQYYSTIQLADVDGDGQAELIVRSSVGILVNHFDPALGQWMPIRYDDSTGLWFPILDGPQWSDAAGWGEPQYYSTIQCGDVAGDRRAQILARGYYGIYALKFNNNGTWDPLPDGPALSDQENWNQPEYYSTIRLADIDNDGCAELVARGYGGIVAWRYEKGSGTWVSLPDGPAWSDDQNWNQPEYYSTIRLADIDGDGCAELVARSAAGIVAYRFEKDQNAWVALPNGPAWSDDENWSQPEYYSTIRLADIDNDGHAELLARGAGGIVGARFDKEQNAWVALPDGPPLSDDGNWNQPQYYSTIQYADIDGDKQDELIARGYEGIVAWHYDKLKGAWAGMPDGPGLSDPANWDQPQYYSTIQLADVDGDGQAELIARAAAGLITWRVDKKTLQWSETSAPFVAYTEGKETAYEIISRKLMDDIAGADIRSTYSSKAADFDNYLDQLSAMTQAQGGVTQADWDAVRQQLHTELSAASAAQGLFDQLDTFQTGVFFSNSLSLDAVAKDLEVSTDSDDAFAVAMISMFGNVVWSLSGIGGTAAGVIGGLFASAVGAGAGVGVGDPIGGDYVGIKNQLNAQFQLMSVAIDADRQSVAQDWGLLGSVGQLVAQDIWQWTGGDDANAKNAAWYGYAVSLWQILAPSVWLVEYGYDDEPSVVGVNNYPMQYTYAVRGVNPNKDYADKNIITYWLIKRNALAWNPVPSQLSTLFDAPPNGISQWVATDPLGISTEECLTNQDGWSFELREHSIY